MASSYSMTIEVGPEHLDELDHVNNVVYIEWVQEIARQHWEKVTNEEDRTNRYWVVSRHEVEYKASAKLGDRLTLETVVKSFRGPISVRQVSVMRGDQLLVQAVTHWVFINEAHKPQRVPASLVDLFL